MVDDRMLDTIALEAPEVFRKCGHEAAGCEVTRL